MSNTNIFFPSAQNGYDIKQVDDYIAKLSEAYQAAYEENQALCRCNKLLTDYNKMFAQEHDNQTSQNIIKTMMYTDMLTQKIIADAHEEAAKVKEKIIKDANAEAARIVMRARKNFEQANEIIEEALSKVDSLLAFNVPHIKSAIAG